jgi:hypothetical protein
MKYSLPRPVDEQSRRTRVHDATRSSPGLLSQAPEGTAAAESGILQENAQAARSGDSSRCSNRSHAELPGLKL